MHSEAIDASILRMAVIRKHFQSNVPTGSGVHRADVILVLVGVDREVGGGSRGIRFKDTVNQFPNDNWTMIMIEKERGAKHSLPSLFQVHRAENLETLWSRLPIRSQFPTNNKDIESIKE